MHGLHGNSAALWKRLAFMTTCLLLKMTVPIIVKVTLPFFFWELQLQSVTHSWVKLWGLKQNFLPLLKQPKSTRVLPSFYPLPQHIVQPPHPKQQPLKRLQGHYYGKITKGGEILVSVWFAEFLVLVNRMLEMLVYYGWNSLGEITVIQVLVAVM